MDESIIQETPPSDEVTTEESQQILDFIDNLFTRYEVLTGDISDILFTYIVVLIACIVIYPATRMIVYSISKGLSKWRT